MSLYHFPRWTDSFRPILGLAAVLIPTFLVVVFAYGASAENLNTGYAPEQPVPFSHRIHAGQLGMDCRYCHSTVEDGAMAAVPPTSTCVNCHAQVEGKVSVRPDSTQLAPIAHSFETGEPVEWVRVHDLPEYVYFNHSAHLSAGVGCVECHGRVDTMERVTQVEPLSMGWCLECHRDPDARLRPREFVTDMNWSTDEDRVELGKRLREQNDIDPRTDCSTCHR